MNRYPSSLWAKSSYDILRHLEESGLQLQVEGIENFANKKGPFVFISNHMSTMETLILPSLIQPLQETTFITKKELTTYPMFGPILRSRNPITLGRTNPREDLQHVFQGGVERLKKGISIIVFPQSTRSYLFIPEKFNSIGV